MANTPNISRDSFNFAKWYNNVVLQQGVPIMDSDWNELGDIQIIQRILTGAHVLGDMFLPAELNNEQGALFPGYQVQEATSPSNNFKISGGWAVCKGLLVPTTAAYPPANHDYDSDTNRMGEGTVSSVNGGAVTISDDEKNWQVFHALVGCRVKMTSGAESGNTFTVISRVNATTLELNSVGSIAATDTYIVKPPALTTPSGSDRDDVAYLMVWIEDISSGEDSVLTHPATSIESCHRKQVRWCVRVAENGTTPSTPDVHDISSAGGVRYSRMAYLNRLDGNSNITSSMLEPVASSSKLSLSSKTSGLLVAEPYSVSKSVVATNKVQLIGNFFVGTDGFNPTSFFSVHGTPPTQTRRTPYIESGDLVEVTGVRNSSDTASLNMATDPTPEGFYSNPYIVFSKSFTDNVYIHCLVRRYIPDISQDPAILLPGATNDVIPHGSKIWSNAHSGSPTSLSATTISSQLNSLLSAVNARSRIASSETISGAWSFSAALAFANILNFNTGAYIKWNPTSGTDFQLIFENSDTYRSRIYNSPSLGGLIFTYNAWWDDAANLWKYDVNGPDSMAFGLSVLGLNLYRMGNGDPAYATGWTHNNWTSILTFGSSESSKSLEPMNAFGVFGSSSDAYDRVRVSLGVQNRGVGTTTYFKAAGVTWHAKLNGPLSGDVTLSANTTSNWSLPPVVEWIDAYGASVDGSSDSIGPGVIAYWIGSVIIDTAT